MGNTDKTITVSQSELIEPLGGCDVTNLTIIPNDYLPQFENKLFRFPRSKKRRIKNKWQKRESSWRLTIPYVITGTRLYIHPDNIDLLKLGSL